jgi:tRNA-Thr(GGU) m(6)t(6)A37 methyltransferase TsaA
MEKITLKPIGIIHSPFKNIGEAPAQPKLSNNAIGEIVINKEFSNGLKDLNGFSHIMIVTYLHKSHTYNLLIKPKFDNEIRGVFATKSPNRPNPIGISIVKLERIESNILYVSGLDVIDGTPILDIKPFIPDRIDEENLKLGWTNGKI